MKTLAPPPPTEFKEFCDDCIPVSERLVKTSQCEKARWLTKINEAQHKEIQ